MSLSSTSPALKSSRFGSINQDAAAKVTTARRSDRAKLDSGRLLKTDPYASSLLGDLSRMRSGYWYLLNPDSAVEMDTCRVIKGRAWRSEGTEANNFDTVMVLGPGLAILSSVR